MKLKSIAFLIFAAITGAVLRADEPALEEPLDFVVESVVVEDTCQNPLINTAPTKEGWRITKEKIQVNGNDWVFSGGEGSLPNEYGSPWHEMHVDFCAIVDSKVVTLDFINKLNAKGTITEFYHEDGLISNSPACTRIFKEWPCTVTRKYSGKLLE